MSTPTKHSMISKARAGLIIDQPFFASILLPMPISEDASIPTMATDGESIKFNPDWTAKLSLPEVTFVLAHEVLHCVFDHMGRRGQRGPNRWNQAADYIINELLVKEKIGSMPHGGLLNPSLTAQGGNTAEGVYKLLPEEDEQKEPGQEGGAMDQVHDAGSDQGAQPTDAATMAEKSAQLKVRVIQAKNAAKMQGKLSAGIERLVDDLVKPVVDWKTVLRRFVSDRAKVDYSFTRPKRRFLAEDFYLPSLTGQKIGALVVAVDCSGSVDDDLLAAFSAELNAIREDVSPSQIDVIYFDSKVCHTVTFLPDDDFKLESRGGGGTAFSPIFKHIESMPDLPVACIVLTDLECSDYGDAPPYPVLWTCLDGVADHYKNTPFGEVLEVKD